ncbi:MAG: hypothetical protein AABY84_13070 [Candidatus Firestonebacteria bacterium]
MLKKSQKKPWYEIERERIKSSKIKSFTIWVYSYKNGKLKNSYKQLFLEYDYNGYPVKQTHYNSNGSIHHILVEKFNSEGKQIWDISICPESNIRNKMIYKCDNKGRINEEIWWYISKKYKYIMRRDIYDVEGRKIECLYYDSKHNVKHRTIYKYDTVGNKITIGETGKESMQKYDNNGNEIENILYLSNGDIKERRIFEYDENSNKTKEKRYNLHGRMYMKKIYMYYRNRRIGLIINRYNLNGDIKNKIRDVVKYDSKNNIVECSCNNKQDKTTMISKYIYEYYSNKKR